MEGRIEQSSCGREMITREYETRSGQKRAVEDYIGRTTAGHARPRRAGGYAKVCNERSKVSSLYKNHYTADVEHSMSCSSKRDGLARHTGENVILQCIHRTQLKRTARIVPPSTSCFATSRLSTPLLSPKATSFALHVSPVMYQHTHVCSPLRLFLALRHTKRSRALFFWPHAVPSRA